MLIGSLKASSNLHPMESRYKQLTSYNSPRAACLLTRYFLIVNSLVCPLNQSFQDLQACHLLPAHSEIMSSHGLSPKYMASYKTPYSVSSDSLVAIVTRITIHALQNTHKYVAHVIYVASIKIPFSLSSRSMQGYYQATPKTVKLFPPRHTYTLCIHVKS